MTEPADGINRFAIPLDELEDSVHVSLEDQVVEIPATKPGRTPGDDDLSREYGQASRSFG
jgi:hypothetical protein